MCGICGVVAVHDTYAIDDALVRRMNQDLRHRGPDDEGYFFADRVGLGIRRLSVIDVSGGHQPIFNEVKTACIVLNGEIYNYRELRRLLEDHDHRFSTRSDTEAIIHAYEQWGDDCLQRLRGMFAFAIWDAERARLFAARDRLGKKPLYYHVDDKRLVFASEIKALLNDPAVPRRLNYRALDAYLTLGYVPGPDTLFEGIWKVPPGHSLQVANHAYQIRPYWNLEDAPDESGFDSDAGERLMALLEESVRMRLVADVPIGALLSGGIDSSLVVALMMRVANAPVRTYSVGFSDPDLNELAFARTASRHLGSIHHEVLVDRCPQDLLESIVWSFDEPVADPAAVPTLVVSQLARRDVTVVLTGEGGDELFGGYDYYRAHPWPHLRHFLPETLRLWLLPRLAARLNAIAGRPRYHERTIWSLSLPDNVRSLAWVAIFTDDALSRLYHAPAHVPPGLRYAQQVYGAFSAALPGSDSLRRSMYVDTKVWLPDDLLMKVDKMTMATSLEARCPYLDHRLVEFAWELPSRAKVRGKIGKVVLKEIAAKVLPASLVGRRKQGFIPPIGRWLTHELADVTRSTLSAGVVRDSALFDRAGLERLWSGAVQAEPGKARQVWTLLNLGMWAEQYKVSAA